MSLRQLLLLGLLLASLACRSSAPTAVDSQRPAPPASTIDLSHPSALIPNDSEVRRGRLGNGLTYYLRENRRPEARAELRLVVRAGSIHEDPDQLGLAHFVEHMAFNGTRHFAKQEMVDYLQSIGMRFGADVNAFTGFEQTVYSLQVPTDEGRFLQRALLVLFDWAAGVALEEEEIENERGVVIEEWRSGRGAAARVRDQQIPVLFKGSRYAERLPIGDPSLLASFEPRALRRFYRDWYRPDLMAVVAVGDFEVDRVERLIRKRFSSWRAPRQARSHFDAEVPPQPDLASSLVVDPELTRSTVQLSYKYRRDPGDTVAHARRAMAGGLALAMLRARLGELQQQADPPFLSASTSLGPLTSERGIFSLSATVADGGLERGLAALLGEAERVRRHGFVESELERARTNLLRAVERSYQERDKTPSAALAAAYVRHFVSEVSYPSAATELALAGQLLPEITLLEVVERAERWLASPDRVLLSTAPEKEEGESPDIARLVAVLERAPELELAPWVDRVAESPLLDVAPALGKIVARSQKPDLGVTVWTLSNGVRVILKPTDFQDDSVMFAAFSPGGHSLVSDQEHVAASTAASVLRLSGLGDHDLVQLQKLLAGKAVSVSPYIGELFEGMGGGGSSEDLETLFQLIYLTQTAPRSEEAAFQSFVTRLRGLIANRSAQPEWALEQTIAEVMSQGHSRRRTFDEELLEELDLDTSLRVYRDRFADASDFTFLFVGSFDLEQLQPLVETYLGSLPDIGRSESWRDVGVRGPRGLIERTVRRGIEPKARLELIFSGPFEQSRQNRYELSALTELLRERLRRRLREEMAGTYGVAVTASTSMQPLEEYRLAIGFECDPEKLEELAAAAFSELERIRRKPAGEEEVAKIRESQRRSRETALRDNGFWLGALQFAYQHGEDPEKILGYEQRVAGLSAGAIQAAARRHIDFENYAQFVLLPEEPAADGRAADGRDLR